MINNHYINRRQMLHRIASTLGVVLTASLVPCVMADIVGVSIKQGQAGNTLSATDVTLIDRIADIIIPATDTPGAHEVGVVGFIDILLTKYETADGRQQFIKDLKGFRREADQLIGGQFLLATSAAQVNWLRKVDQQSFIDSTAINFYRKLKEIIMISYYTSEIGASKELNYLAIPGPYKGDIPVTSETRSWAT